MIKAIHGDVIMAEKSIAETWDSVWQRVCAGRHTVVMGSNSIAAAPTDLKNTMCRGDDFQPGHNLVLFVAQRLRMNP